MSTPTSILCKYLGDFIAIVVHCNETMGRQLAFSFVQEDAGARQAMQDTHAVLTCHVQKLEERLQELQGSGTWKESVSSLTGFLTGLYDGMRSEALSRALRDDYVALHFIFACQTMLITTAGACGDGSTAELVVAQQRDLPALIKKISDQIPPAVARDVARDGAPNVRPEIVTRAIEASHSAWHESREAASL